ncbi:hypothetical protein [Streptomyces xanthophaeus]
MTTWFRTYYEDEDLWLYFEADDEGWAARHIEVRGKDSRPVTAASSEEVLYVRDHADGAAMGCYERQYGVLAEGVLDGWQDQPQAAELSAEEFERLWVEARGFLGASGRCCGLRCAGGFGAEDRGGQPPSPGRTRPAS